MLCGLNVSYTVKIHGTIRRSFSLSHLLLNTKQSQTSGSYSPVSSITYLLFYHNLCGIFKINACILSVIIQLFFNTLNLLI